MTGFLTGPSPNLQTAFGTQSYRYIQHLKLQPSDRVINVHETAKEVLEESKARNRLYAKTEQIIAPTLQI